MPTIKRSLSRTGILANLARAKKMRAQGVDIQIREEWEEAARSLDIVVGGGFADMVFDLPGGTAAYAILTTENRSGGSATWTFLGARCSICAS